MIREFTLSKAVDASIEYIGTIDSTLARTGRFNFETAVAPRFGATPIYL